jgi:iron complex outermembrane recepter protein
MKVYLFILSLFFCSITFAQSTITGTVTDSNNVPVSGANVKVKGESASTTSDADGKFSLKTTKKPPFSLDVSSVGFTSQSIAVTSNNQNVTVLLAGEDMKLDEIVVSASRAPERVRESPVTIERMNAKDIKKSASPNFYDGLENLKEVHMNTSSLSFKSINTRGFATVANTRFMQLVDGMDNSSPLLNFVLGNLIGVSEIDVANVELLPGASSALYGANAFNGILFMNSKSPFTSQGITAYAKYGTTNQKAAGGNPYYDYGIRAAHQFTPWFAAKANFSFLRGTDWYATNYDDVAVKGRDRSNIGYNGINVYGDEVALNLKNRNAFGSGAYNLLPNEDISRTGYNEADLTESQVKNAKADFSLHFRPWKSNETEIIAQSKFGIGNSIYQGASRYNLNNFLMQQHKVEVKGKNFFVRGYTTTEDGGQSYDMTFTAININRMWSSDAKWFGNYGAAFGAASLGFVPGVNNAVQAHAYARTVADKDRYIPGTPKFKEAFNKVIKDADVLTGSRLQDNSRIWHSDANYNFKDLFKAAEIQVGGQYRLYELNSGGRIYNDKGRQINYTDIGFYTQIQKKLMEDRLKLTGSVRYDKSKNFAGNFSPRVSAVYSAGADKNHNFRGSFQTGFRNPSTQDQYIGFNIGSRVLLGSAQDNLDTFNETLDVNPGGDTNSDGIDDNFALAGGAQAGINGNQVYNNSFTKESFNKFDALYRSGPPSGLANAAALLVKANAPLVKPETVKAFDLGYRGSLKGFNVDINGYYNIYNDFIGGFNVITPYYGSAVTNPDVATNTSAQALATRNFREYQVYTNTTAEVKSLGLGLGLSKKIYKDFELSGNYNYAEFDFDQTDDTNFEASFNTPKQRVKGSISNDKLFKNFGFNLSARWNSEYKWESSFVDGMIDAATVVDAQINYTVPSMKSTFKIGAANLGGKEYTQVFGAGAIGQQYFASWTINP